MDNKVVGVILVVLGALTLLGWIGLPGFIIGAIALVVGILMLMGKMDGGQTAGIVLTAIGALLVLNMLPFISGAVSNIINTVLGLAMVIYGILKLTNKA